MAERASGDTGFTRSTRQWSQSLPTPPAEELSLAESLIGLGGMARRRAARSLVRRMPELRPRVRQRLTQWVSGAAPATELVREESLVALMEYGEDLSSTDGA